MMTALSQAEDKERATKLGADRYLVKSQVTLEDVAKVAREVLEGESPAPEPTPQTAKVTPDVNLSDDTGTDPQPAPAEPAVAAVPTTPATDVTAPAAPVATPTVDPAAAVTQATPQPTPAEPAVAAEVKSEVEAISQSVKDEEQAIAAQIENFIDSKKTNEISATDEKSIFLGKDDCIFNSKTIYRKKPQIIKS